MPDSGVNLAANPAELYRRPLAPIVKTLQTTGKTAGQPGMKGPAVGPPPVGSKDGGRTAVFPRNRPTPAESCKINGLGVVFWWETGIMEQWKTGTATLPPNHKSGAWRIKVLWRCCFSETWRFSQ